MFYVDIACYSFQIPWEVGRICTLYPHFTDKKTEVQRSTITCSKTQNKKRKDRAESGLLTPSTLRLHRWQQRETQRGTGGGVGLRLAK